MWCRMTKAVIQMNREQDFDTCVLQKQLGFFPFCHGVKKMETGSAGLDG